MVNIERVAKEAGVSVATVSRVLHNSPLVKEKTRDKVQKVIRKLKYEPNMLGTSLRNSKTQTILTLVSNIANPFFSEIIHGIHYVAVQNNYKVLVGEMDLFPEEQESYFNMLRHKLVDGMITLDPAIEPALKKKSLQELADRYPVVQCCEYYEDVNAPYIAIDNRKASCEAVEYLIAEGCRRIALINFDHKYLFSRRRREGYNDALQKHNVDYCVEFTLDGSLDYKMGEDAVDFLFSQDEKPDALFIVADIFAVGIMKTLMERGMKIPEDIKVVGFDNITLSEFCYPALTTVSQPTFEIGTKAAQLMLEKIHNKGAVLDNILINHELIIRNST